MIVLKMFFAALTMFSFYKIEFNGGVKYIFTGIAAFITSVLLCLIDLIKGVN